MNDKRNRDNRAPQRRRKQPASRRSAGNPAGSRTASRSGRPSAPRRPADTRALAYSGWTIAIILCVLLSIFAFVFASCSGGGADPGDAGPDSSTGVITPNGSPSPEADPDASPSPSVSPVISYDPGLPGMI